MNKSMHNDKWLYRIVVIVLGLTVVTTIVGAIALTLQGQSMPEAVIALGSASVGGLAGLLAPSPINR